MLPMMMMMLTCAKRRDVGGVEFWRHIKLN